MDRSEKVAVARKKLKKFQSRSKSSNKSNHVTEDANGSPPAVHNTAVDEHNDLENGSFGDLHVLEDTRRFSDATQILAYHQADLQSHAKTIDVLIEEKSDLQTQVTRLQSQLKNKIQEAMDLEASLQSTKRKLDETLREKVTLSSNLSKKEEALSLSSGHHSSLEQALQQTRLLLDDQRQENAELVSKVTTLGREVRNLQASNADLQSRLNMTQLLVQQLSAGGTESSGHATPSHQEKLLAIQSEMEALRSSVYKVTSERDQAVMDAAALRDTLTLQQQNHATSLADLQGQLADSHAQTSVLMERLAAFEQERELLTVHVAEVEERSKGSVQQLIKEKAELEQKLQQHVQEIAQLTRLHRQQQDSSHELEAKLTRLQEQVVDQKGLLTTISQDKETISRAMAQNKELKNHLAELQEAFVKQSHHSMEVASELETAKHRWSQLEGQLELAKQQRAQLENDLESVKQKSLQLEGELGSERQQRSKLEGELALERQHRSELEGELGSERQQGPQLQHADIEAERSYRVKLEHQLEMAVLHEAQLEKQLAELKDSVVDHHEHETRDMKQRDEHGSEESHEVTHEDLRGQLEQLEAQYQELSEEHHRVLDQLHRYELSSEHSETLGDAKVDLRNMTSEQLDTFSNSYSALQRKFLALIAEKAELVEQLQAKDHVVMQLSGETETIGEYISLYQLQRQALKSKFMENDRYVQQVMAEKASMQTKLQELQGLVKQLLAEKATSPSLSPSHQIAAEGSGHTPDLNRSLPTHLRHQQFHPAPTASNNTSLPLPRSSPSDTPSIPPTAMQIMNLIKELETHHGPMSKDGVLLCPCCTGEILVL